LSPPASGFRLTAYLATILACVAVSPAHAQDAEAIAVRAGRTFRGLSSFKASFEQVIEDRMIGTQNSKGELSQAGSAHLAMRFSDPKGDLVLLDGTSVWIYTPSTTPGQVIRMAIPTDPVYGPNVLSRILDKPTERYQVTWVREEIVDGRPADVVEFLPTTEDPLFSKAVIWIERSTSLPRRLELDERTGVHRTLILSRLRTNVPTGRNEFVFQVPDGVRVVDR
jgi:outer membrane lipoprotein carrier protein